MSDSDSLREWAEETGILDIDDEDADGRMLTQGDGRPKLVHLGRAIQVWTLCQPGEAQTVGQVARAFNEPPERVLAAVGTVYLLFVSGEGLDATIEHEGV